MAEDTQALLAKFLPTGFLPSPDVYTEIIPWPGQTASPWTTGTAKGTEQRKKNGPT